MFDRNRSMSFIPARRVWITAARMKALLGPHPKPGQVAGCPSSAAWGDEAVGYRLVSGQWPAVVTKYFSDSGRVEFNF
jgi:hypothetical protein